MVSDRGSGMKSNTDVTCTPISSRRDSQKKLFLDRDYKSELGKVMASFGKVDKANKVEVPRLQSIELSSKDKQPLSKNYTPYLPRRIQ